MELESRLSQQILCDVKEKLYLVNFLGITSNPIMFITLRKFNRSNYPYPTNTPYRKRPQGNSRSLVNGKNP
jgi:hypothetical protein